MARKNILKVTFERGLNEYVEATRLEMGFSTVLKNWVPEPDGSLRARVAWVSVSATGEPVTRKVRGIGYNPKHDHMGMVGPGVLVANAETVGGNPGYGFYHVPYDDFGMATSWTLLEQLAGVGWDNDRYVPMVMAGGRLLYCTDDFPYDNTGGTVAPSGGIRAWNGMTGATAYIANSRPGKTMCYYKNRVFTGGGKETTDPAGAAETTNAYSTQPWRLWFSGLLPADLTATNHWDTTSLTNPAGFIEVGKDDGQEIEFVVPFDQGILIGKTDSLYYLVGTSPATFQLIPLDAGEVAPGRSIVVTPYGAVILGRSEAFVFKGNIPEPISTPVSSSYGLTGPFLTGAYADGQVVVVDNGREVMCVYDVENDTWRTETFDGYDPAVVANYQSRLMLGMEDEPTRSLLYFRDMGGDGERGKDFDSGVFLRAKTPDMWLGGAASPTTIRHVYLRYRVRVSPYGSADTPQFLVVKQYKNGALLITQQLAVPAAAGVYRERLDLKGTAYSTQFEFSLETGGSDRQSIDIEELEVHFDTEETR